MRRFFNSIIYTYNKTSILAQKNLPRKIFNPPIIIQASVYTRVQYIVLYKTLWEWPLASVETIGTTRLQTDPDACV